MTPQGQPLRNFVGVTWDILTDKASHQDNISYKELLEMLTGKSQPHPDRPLRPILDFITGYCIGSGAPPLTVPVVNKRDQKPGPGFRGLVADIETARRDVLNYNWQNHAAPVL